VESSREMDFPGAILRSWTLVVLLTVAGAILGLLVSAASPRVYQGRASLLVGDFDNGDVSNNEIQAMQSLAVTYADIARREPVMAGVVRDLGLHTGWRELGKSVHVRVPRESPQVIEITVDGSRPGGVRRIAGAVSDQLLRYVGQTAGPADFVRPQLRRMEQTIREVEQRVDDLRSQQESAGVTAQRALQLEINRAQQQIAAWQNNYALFNELAATSSHVAMRRLDPADASRTPVSPNTRFNTVIVGFTGFVLALAIVYLTESWRRRRSGPTLDPVPDSPLILPPGFPHVTLPANGRSVAPLGSTVPVSGHSEKGDSR
jgi:succinoglycan biosynthesis transport protein ExoP